VSRYDIHGSRHLCCKQSFLEKCTLSDREVAYRVTEENFMQMVGKQTRRGFSLLSTIRCMFRDSAHLKPEHIRDNVTIISDPTHLKPEHIVTIIEPYTESDSYSRLRPLKA
jgi:hypothetical protein